MGSVSGSQLSSSNHFTLLILQRTHSVFGGPQRQGKYPHACQGDQRVTESWPPWDAQGFPWCWCNVHPSEGLTSRKMPCGCLHFREGRWHKCKGLLSLCGAFTFLGVQDSNSLMIGASGILQALCVCVCMSVCVCVSLCVYVCVIFKKSRFPN